MNVPQLERDEHDMKKSYNTPKVQIYGDLRQITQSLSMSTGVDGVNGQGMATGCTRP